MLTSLASDGDKVMVMIDTDGEENSSKEHTHSSITKLVADRKSAGWEFLFMANGIDVRTARSVGATGQSIGMTVNADKSFESWTDTYNHANVQTVQLLCGQVDHLALIGSGDAQAQEPAKPKAPKKGD